MKVWNYFYIGITLIILFQIFGILETSGFLGWIGIERVGDDLVFNFADMNAKFLALFVGASGAGIAIGFLTKAKSENFILIPIILVLITLSSVFIAILTASSGYPSYLKVVISLILVPFIAGYYLALAEWFRGTD